MTDLEVEYRAYFLYANITFVGNTPSVYWFSVRNTLIDKVCILCTSKNQRNNTISAILHLRFRNMKLF